MLILRVVVLYRLADREPFALGDVGEVVRHRLEHFLVDQCLVAERPKISRDVEQRRVRRAVGQWRQRRINGLDTELYGFETAKRAETGGAVGVQLDRNAVSVGE